MSQLQDPTPSEKSKESLNQLSRDFKPDDVKFLLALNSDFSIEESVENAESAIKRLEQYVNNGHSTEGLDFDYVSVKKY